MEVRAFLLAELVRSVPDTLFRPIAVIELDRLTEAAVGFVILIDSNEHDNTQGLGVKVKSPAGREFSTSSLATQALPVEGLSTLRTTRILRLSEFNIGTRETGEHTALLHLDGRAIASYSFVVCPDRTQRVKVG